MRNAAGGLCGSSVMGASAAYPKRLGYAIFEAWITWRGLQESGEFATGVLESQQASKQARSSKSATRVLESRGSDSDSSSCSPAWADSPKQQRAGKRKQVLFQLLLPCDAAQTLLNEIRRDFRGSGMHYWLMPVVESGHLE